MDYLSFIASRTRRSGGCPDLGEVQETACRGWQAIAVGGLDLQAIAFT